MSRACFCHERLDLEVSSSTVFYDSVTFLILSLFQDVTPTYTSYHTDINRVIYVSALIVGVLFTVQADIGNVQLAGIP